MENVKWWQLIMQLQYDPFMCLRFSGDHIHGDISKSAIIDGPVYIGKNTKIDHFAVIEGPVYIGDNSIIGSHSKIRGGSYIGNNVLVGSYTDIKTSIIHDNTQVGPVCVIPDSYIESNVFIGGRFIATNVKVNNKSIRIKNNDTLELVNTNKLGCYLGKGCRISSRSMIMPGRSVEPCAIVLPMSLIM